MSDRQNGVDLFIYPLTWGTNLTLQIVHAFNLFQFSFNLECWGFLKSWCLCIFSLPNTFLSTALIFWMELHRSYGPNESGINTSIWTVLIMLLDKHFYCLRLLLLLEVFFLWYLKMLGRKLGNLALECEQWLWEKLLFVCRSIKMKV